MSDDFDMRAAEYVLGTLDADARAAFSREIDANPEARAAVADWEKRLMPLATPIAPVAPPADLWPRIEGALPAAQVAPFAADNVVVLRRKVRTWRGVAIATSVLAASLSVFVSQRELFPPRPVGVYFAAVNRGGGQPALIVRVDMATHTVYVRSISAEAPEGKSLELWVIPPGEQPKSMGLVTAGAERLPAPQGVPIEKATFAVSVEPPGGSPTGAPTGPVVYSGELVQE